MRVELLTFEGCPHAKEAEERLRRAVRNIAPDAQIESIDVTEEDVVALRFQGSPSIRVDGEDIEGRDSEPFMGCRNYAEDGPPPMWLIEAALLRALRPRHILFLCVANSARSQMAEGLARSMAPAAVRISSAGSEPTTVRPEAIAALSEIGIDISGHASKGVGTFEDVDDVDTVVTLCAEEVCPVWLGKAHRLHWGLPDPAAVQDPEQRKEAFQSVRDELKERFSKLFRE